MLIAITREVSPNIGCCELTHLERQPVDVERARAQHHQYTACLAALGCQVQRLPPEPDWPDSVFVEDTAVVLDELAILTRPGARSRLPETASVARALEPYRKLYPIQAPGTLDGGDVLRIGKTIYIGLSSRSNSAAIEQVRDIVRPFGYTVKSVNVGRCLHLKSAVTQVAEDTLLIQPDWVDANAFGTMQMIKVDPSEPHAGNALLIDEMVVYPASYPRTQERLESRGLSVMTVDVSELIKAEGAVTCCSLVFRRDAPDHCP